MGDENTSLDQVWADDLLGRRADANFLQAFLVGRMTDRQRAGIDGSYVLNIDARWGAGKTFFLDRLARQLELSGHVVAQVNAWRDDHLDDPFIAILAAIDQALHPYVAKRGKVATAWRGVKDNAIPIAGKFFAGATKTFVKKFIGKEFVDELGDIISGHGDTGSSSTGKLPTDDKPTPEDRSLVEEALAEGASEAMVQIESVIDQGAQKLIDVFNDQIKATDSFREKLGKAVSALDDGKRPPLFILVDELDRCRPSYAVALLERVKHLFDANNVVFIFATNSDQLQFSITGAYGAGFDGFKYLKRFFDRTYLLTNLSIEEFVKTEAINIDQNKFRVIGKEKIEFLILGFNSYKMDLREVTHVMDIISSVLSAWRHDFPIDLALLLPIAVYFYRKGNISWMQAEADIPDGFIVHLGLRANRNTGRSEPVFLKVSKVFQLSREAAISMEKAMDLGNNSMSPEQRYAYETFAPEWNGKAVQRNARSMQLEIGDLVAHAGKITTVEMHNDVNRASN